MVQNLYFELLGGHFNSSFIARFILILFTFYQRTPLKLDGYYAILLATPIKFLTRAALAQL
jgi:hypothetical protein